MKAFYDALVSEWEGNATLGALGDLYLDQNPDIDSVPNAYYTIITDTVSLDHFNSQYQGLISVALNAYVFAGDNDPADVLDAIKSEFDQNHFTLSTGYIDRMRRGPAQIMSRGEDKQGRPIHKVQAIYRYFISGSY